MLNKLRFVRPEDDESGDGMVQKAIEVLQQKGVEPKWEGPGITTTNKSLVYVLANFDCAEFKILLGKCRIIGPSVVIAHVNNGWPLPASTQPVFSMTMRGIVACFTQTGARERRERLSHLVQLMGGKVQKDYTKHVTHLIAGQVGSTKYNVARDLCMPVMLPSWIEHCWKCNLDSNISALDSAIVEAHRCPPFTGCTVTVTGLEERERKKVREVVENNGGAYSGELTKDICTHLLVGSTTSAKYKFAQQWQIYCVSSQWLYDSAECGYCLSESSYGVEEQQEGDGKNKKSDKDGNPSVQWSAALMNYQLPTAKSNTLFLDGCRIYLTGFTEIELVKLHKIINLGGGARYNHLSESLTHVVLGLQEPSTVASIRKLEEIPHVVNVLWLLACCTNEERVEEQEYVCLELTTLPSDRGPEGDKDRRAGNRDGQGKRKRRLEEEGEREGKDGKKPRVDGRQQEDGNDETIQLTEEEALLLQYQNAEFPVAGGGDTNQRREEEEEEEEDGSREGVLSGIKLAVSCLFTSSDQTVAASVLKQQGSEVVDVDKAHYLLSPLEVLNRKAPRREEEIISQAAPVTMIWLQRSIDAGKALEPSSNFLFQPLSFNMIDNTLTGCVLAFSQFSDLEREHLIRFSKGLGAIVQDYFTHYPAHGLLATTHIILKRPEGDKYHHSMQWGVPAIADSWLFACAEHGGIVPVESHLIHLQQSSSIQPHHPPLPEGHRESRPTAECDETTAEEEEDEMGPPPPINTAAQRQPHIEKEDSERGKEVESRDEILVGVILCLHKKIPSQAHIHNVAGSLGADCHWSFDDSCTHYIYQGKAAEAVRDREVRAARENGCIIVSPHWIHACISEGRRVEESSFPHTFNPKMALNMVTSKVSTTQQQQHRQEEQSMKPVAQSQQSHQKRVPDTTTVQAAPATTTTSDPVMNDTRISDTVVRCSEGSGNVVSEPKRKDDLKQVDDKGREVEEVVDKRGNGEGTVMSEVTSEVMRKIQQQLEEIKEAPRETRRRKSRRLQQQEPADVPAPPSSPPPQTTRHRIPSHRRGRRRNRRREETLTDSQISDSQVLQVTYDDPEGRREKAKLLARIEREEQLRAKGLDPSQFRDSNNSLEGRRLNLDLEVGGGEPAAATITTTSVVTQGQSTMSENSRLLRPEQPQTTNDQLKDRLIQDDSGPKRNGVRNKGVVGSSRVTAATSGLVDRDYPSSTPAPPSLGVPIVTHSKRQQDVNSLFDEKAMQARRKARSPPKFLLSCLEQREKVDYGALIQELGGEYIEQDYFTTNCTHLITGKANRTEKFLGACAAGKWVLHKSYIESCRAEHRFVEEDGHEWGVNAGDNPLELAPCRWRMAIAQQKMSGTALGAFQGWKVLVFAERNKLTGLKRLLEAGGARVFSNGAKLSMEELKQISHAFINMNFFPKDSLSLEDLVRCGVSCLKPEYIAEYLSKGDVPIDQFLINPLPKRYEE